MSPSQASPRNVDVFEGIEADLTDLSQFRDYVHAGPRVVAEVDVPPGEEHLFCYDKGLHWARHASQCTDFIPLPTPDFSWSDRAAGADLGPWSSQASRARREPTTLTTRTSQDPEGSAQLSLPEPQGELESEWFNSTESVPPSGVIVSGLSRRP